jgi:hypothetical protein
MWELFGIFLLLVSAVGSILGETTRKNTRGRTVLTSRGILMVVIASLGCIVGVLTIGEKKQQEQEIAKEAKFHRASSEKTESLVEEFTEPKLASRIRVAAPELLEFDLYNPGSSILHLRSMTLHWKQENDEANLRLHGTRYTGRDTPTSIDDYDQVALYSHKERRSLKEGLDYQILQFDPLITGSVSMPAGIFDGRILGKSGQLKMKLENTHYYNQGGMDYFQIKTEFSSGGIYTIWVSFEATVGETSEIRRYETSKSLIVARPR